MDLKQNIALKGAGRVLKQSLASSLSPAAHSPLTPAVTQLDYRSLSQIASLVQKVQVRWDYPMPCQVLGLRQLPARLPWWLRQCLGSSVAQGRALASGLG